MVWDKATGRPIDNAIVWQDTRTDRLVPRAGRRGRPGPLPRQTAACRWPPISPGPKIRWLLDNVDGARERAEARRVAVRHHRRLADLEAHRRAHVTDVTNASRTMLMNLKTLDWDDGPAGGDRRPARHAAGDPALVGGLRRDARGRAGRRAGGRRWATSRRRCSARPASRPARASAPTAPAASCWSTPARAGASKTAC